MPDPDSAARFVLITAPDIDVARRLARALLDQHLIACANLLPAVTSLYHWEGAIEEDSEVLMVCKTRAERLAAIEALLSAEHPYDVPECIALEPARVEPRYLAWLLTATAGEA